MCTPEFLDAMIPVPEAGGRVSDPNNRRSRNPFDANDPYAKGTAEKQRKGIKFDTAVLRRSGMSEGEAQRLARFAGTRGGLDEFANIEAARRAFAESGAFTQRALVPAATTAASRVSLKAPSNDTKVGATELIGLPLIRRG